MARITRYLMLAAIGGFIGWAVVEPFEALTPYHDVALGLGAELTLGAIFGLFIGAGIAAATALSGVSPRDALKSMILGLLVGAAGGALGFHFGNVIYQPFHAAAQGTSVVPSGPPSFIGFILNLIGRSVGWALMGMFIGLAPGLATESTKKMVNGAVGGFIGGAAGGFTFQILTIFGVHVVMLRMIGFTATGAAIGLFIGFIEELTKRAWLVHLRGLNEGKEFQIFKPETVVGRNELIDVPVFGDPDIEPRHFVIRADESKHLLQDCGTNAGTAVNGQKVQQQVLRDGDIIQVGMTRFLFRDKATRSSAPRRQSYTGAAIPTGPNVCPFCGSTKDASGNCSCTVGAPTAGVTQQQTVPVSASPVPGQGRLVAMSGPYSGQSYELPMAGEITIGRQADRTVSLANDNTVSRQHARIANEGGQYVIYDLGSANGTYVNSAKISQQSLTNGDIVQIGSTKFRIEL